VDGQVPAVVSQAYRDCATDPPAGTGYQCHLLFALDLGHSALLMQGLPVRS
jgi:hypothetical protein